MIFGLDAFSVMLFYIFICWVINRPITEWIISVKIHGIIGLPLYSIKKYGGLIIKRKFGNLRRRKESRIFIIFVHLGSFTFRYIKLQPRKGWEGVSQMPFPSQWTTLDMLLVSICIFIIELVNTQNSITAWILTNVYTITYKSTAWNNFNLSGNISDRKTVI